MIFERRRTATLALALAFLVTAGCGEEGPEPVARKAIAIAELPTNVRDAARKALPDAELNDSWQNLDRENKLQSYEIRGLTKKGKRREVRVGVDGKILEIE